LYKLTHRVRIVRSLKELKEILLFHSEERIIYSSILENHLDILKPVQERVLGNGVSAVKLVRPGKAWWSLATSLGVRIPRFSLDGLTDGSEWLIKPFKSGGGRNIYLWRKGMKVKRGYYLQEFVRGKSISFLFFSQWKRLPSFRLYKAAYRLQGTWGR